MSKSQSILLQLLKDLKTFSSRAEECVSQFCELSTYDLGSYVTTSHVEHFLSNRSYPIQEHISSMHKLLDQSSRSCCETVWSSTLFQSKDAVLSWFLLPPKTKLMLHDHCTMTVFQRVLQGSITACEIEVEEGISSPLTGVVAFNGIIPPHSSGVGIAAKKNFVHELSNVDEKAPALFIDLISPPYYMSPTNITCSYYNASREGRVDEPSPLATLAKGDRVTLTPREGYTPAFTNFIRVNSK